jgi:hypothetical protein
MGDSSTAEKPRELEIVQPASLQTLLAHLEDATPQLATGGNEALSQSAMQVTKDLFALGEFGNKTCGRS